MSFRSRRRLWKSDFVHSHSTVASNPVKKEALCVSSIASLFATWGTQLCHVQAEQPCHSASVGGPRNAAMELVKVHPKECTEPGPVSSANSESSGVYHCTDMGGGV